MRRRYYLRTKQYCVLLQILATCVHGAFTISKKASWVDYVLARCIRVRSNLRHFLYASYAADCKMVGWFDGAPWIRINRIPILLSSAPFRNKHSFHDCKPQVALTFRFGRHGLDLLDIFRLGSYKKVLVKIYYRYPVPHYINYYMKVKSKSLRYIRSLPMYVVW